MLSPQNNVGMRLIVFIEVEQYLNSAGVDPMNTNQLPTYCGSTLKIMQTNTCIKGGCIDTVA